MKVDGIEIVIESDAKKAIAELDKLIAKLGQASTAMQSVKGMKNASTGIKGTANSLKSYTGTANKAAKSTFSLASAFGKFYASCFLVIRGVKAIGKSIESSMDYIETYNYYNVIMDKIGTEFGSAWKENGYNSADEYAKSFKQRLNALTGEMTGFKIGEEGGLYASNSIGLGLDPEKIMSFQAQVASITNAVGLIGETSTNTSKALTMLAADMSSLKNVDIETVMTNFQSGLIGQSRALYKYGIDITNNTLAEYALAEGISKKVSEMTQAEKMQLRMLAILDQSKVAYGDMANTINGVANQYRIFKQQVSNLARTIGNLFIPVLQKVLPYVNGFIIALQRLFTWVGNLLGVDWSKMMDGISSGYTDTGLEALGDSADDTTSALEDADKAAKKLKSTIFGYDELNVATDPTGGKEDKDSLGGGIDLSGAIADALNEYESVWDKAMKDMENRANEIADKIQSAFSRMWKAIEPFRNSVKKLWDEGLSKFADFTWTALKDFYNDFLVPIGEWAFGTEDKGLTRLVNVINNSLMKIDWATINKNLKDFWIAIEPYAENFGEGLIDFFEDMSGIAVDVINNVFGKGGALENLTGALNKGDPENARKWGYALGVIATALLVFKGLNSVATTILAISSALKGLSILKVGAGVTSLLSALSASKLANNLYLAKNGLISFSTAITSSLPTITSLNAALSSLSTFSKIAILISVAVIGFETGLKLGDWLDKTFGDGSTHDYYVNFHWLGEGGFFDTISKDWGTTLDGMFLMLNDNEKPLISALARAVVGPFISSIASIKGAWNDAKKFFEEHSLSDWWESEKALNKQWGTDIANGFSEMRVNAELKLVAMKQSMSIWWNGVKLDFVNAIDGIVGYVGTFPGKIWLALNTIQNKFIMFKAGVEDTFSSIGANIKISFENAFDGLKQSWNNFANWLNSKLKFDVGEIKNPLSGEVISKGFSIDLGKIPGFAGGGFPDTSRPFVVGENGPEIFGSINGKAAVTPSGSITDGIKQAVIEGMMEVTMAASNSNNTSQNDDRTPIVMDGRVVAEITYKNFIAMQRQGLMPKLI